MKRSVSNRSMYIWMLIFIIGVRGFFFISDSVFPENKALKEAVELRDRLEIDRIEESLKANLSPDQGLKEIWKEKRPLLIAISAFFIIISLGILAGFILSIIFIILRFQKKKIIKSIGKIQEVNWDILDVFKVIIVYFFFAYLISILQIALVKIGVLPKELSKNAMMIFDGSILSILVFIMISYFIIVKYKQTWSSLGLSLKNYFKGIAFGIITYVTILPTILLILVLVTLVANRLGYQPPPHPLFRIIFLEKNLGLVWCSVFLGIVLGPIIEEVFFRGFVYPVIKKRTGLRGAIVLSSSLFALAHSSVISFVPVLVLGIALAWLYEKSGSLIASITLHIIHNSLMISTALLLRLVVS